MTDIAFIQHVESLRQERCFDDILRLVERRFEAAEAMPAPGRRDYFFTLFEWKMLIDEYPPAAVALARARDAQARRLLAGEFYVGSAAHDPAQFQRADRLGLMLEMNRTLRDPGVTRAVFLQLEARDPVLARRNAYRVLEDIVETGDFALAERYRGDPLELLRNVNHAAQSMPLFPPAREAPRLAADLSNLIKDVRIAIAVLRGLGRLEEAGKLRAALRDGLANDELRNMAERDLEEPGFFRSALAAHRMAQEESEAAAPASQTQDRGAGRPNR